MKLAYVFPGQGSQYIGMLSDLAKDFPEIKNNFHLASNLFGIDFWELIQSGPQEELNKTQNTQIVMLLADVAMHSLLIELGNINPMFMAGHSLGEYAALVAASALSLEDAVKLVQRRALLMQATVPQGKGAMAAIVGLEDEQVSLICDDASTKDFQVSPANFNAIGQVVIAGHKEAVDKAISLAEKANARLAKLIPVSVPCHCSLLEPTALSFKDDLASAPFKAPKYPVISNVDLSIYESPEQMRTLLATQLYKPVRWVETIQFLKKQGVEQIIECGPGKVLAGLIKRIDKSLAVHNFSDKSSLNEVVSHIRI